jgi:hypothetical protein
LLVVLGLERETTLRQSQHEIPRERTACSRVVLALALVAGPLEELLVPPADRISG